MLHLKGKPSTQLSKQWAPAGSTNAISDTCLLIPELELASLKSAPIPGVAEAVDKSQVGAPMIDDDPDSVPLVGESGTRYRALAARCNYIAVDRADAQFCP